MATALADGWDPLGVVVVVVVGVVVVVVRAGVVVSCVGVDGVVVVWAGPSTSASSWAS